MMEKAEQHRKTTIDIKTLVPALVETNGRKNFLEAVSTKVQADLNGQP